MTRIRDDHKWCLDRNGYAWTRSSEGTWSGYSRDELEATYGPLTPLVEDDGNRVTLEWAESGAVEVLSPDRAHRLLFLAPQVADHWGFILPPKPEPTVDERAAEVIEPVLRRGGMAHDVAAQDAAEVVQELKDAGLLKDGNDE